MDNLYHQLSESDKEILIKETRLYVQKGSLYIKLDKQAAVSDKLRLYKMDPIHIRIRFKKKKIDDIVKSYLKRGILT